MRVEKTIPPLFKGTINRQKFSCAVILFGYVAACVFAGQTWLKLEVQRLLRLLWLRRNSLGSLLAAVTEWALLSGQRC